MSDLILIQRACLLFAHWVTPVTKPFSKRLRDASAASDHDEGAHRTTRARLA